MLYRLGKANFSPIGGSITSTRITSEKRHRNHSRPHFNREHTSHTSKMSEQEVTYSTLRFHNSSGLQNQVKTDKTQGPRETGHRGCSVSWHLIMIPLGILCSILLVTVAVLVTHIFQYSQEKHELQEALNNLHHNYSTMQNESYLNEEMLGNKSLECDAYKSVLDSLNRQQNTCLRLTNIILDCLQHKGRQVNVHLFCCGIKCYYFIMDKKQWKECEQACQGCKLSLLTIDDEDELKFLQLQVTPDSYWIGLSYDNKKHDSAWIDNNPSKFSLNIKKYYVKDENFVLLSKTRLGNSKRESVYPCICEKRLDKSSNCFTNKS